MRFLPANWSWRCYRCNCPTTPALKSPIDQPPVIQGGKPLIGWPNCFDWLPPLQLWAGGRAPDDVGVGFGAPLSYLRGQSRRGGSLSNSANHRIFHTPCVGVSGLLIAALHRHRVGRLRPPMAEPSLPPSNQTLINHHWPALASAPAEPSDRFCAIQTGHDNVGR